MRINWGHKIASVYLLFVGGILFLVFQSGRQRVDLVTKEYYEEEIAYQHRIDQSKRAEALSQRVRAELGGGDLSVTLSPEFEGRDADVRAHLYCPSDERKDLHLQTVTDNRSFRMRIPADRKGMHVLKLSWASEGVEYYEEQPVFID